MRPLGRSARQLALALLGLAAALAPARAGRFQRVGIMTATAAELAPFAKAMRPAGRDEVAGRTFLLGELEGTPVVLVEGGVGKVNAALTASLLVHQYKVDLLFFSGVGGGLHPDLTLGDVVLASRVVQGDYVKIAGGRASSRPVKRLDHDGAHRSTFLEPPAALLGAAQAAGKRSDLAAVVPGLGRRTRVFSGTICTQDAFVTDETHHQYLRSRFQGVISEMEGAAVAQVARASGVPWLVVRGVSDHTNGLSSLLYPLSRSRAARNAALVVMNTLFDVQGDGAPAGFTLPLDDEGPEQLQP